MKAIFISFAMLLLTAETKSQTIPNAGFENWTTDIWDNHNPDDWQTSNVDFQGEKIDTGAGYQGIWSLKAINYGTTSFAYAKCRFAATNHPSVLKAYVRTIFASIDSVNIEVIVFGNGLAVDSGIWFNSNISPISTWSPISISISQTNLITDSVEIRINGGHAAGTILYVDELSFTLTGINENENSCCLTVFPNPTNNELIIQNSFSHSLQFSLYNSLGEKLVEKSLSDKTSTINLSAYENAIYFYKVNSEKQEIKSGKIVKQ